MWANRETRELYVHVGINDTVDVSKLVLDDFYFGDELKRTPEIARMRSDVGSLWPLDWSGLAKTLFEDGEHKLEPPE